MVGFDWIKGETRAPECSHPVPVYLFLHLLLDLLLDLLLLHHLLADDRSCSLANARICSLPSIPCIFAILFTSVGGLHTGNAFHFRGKGLSGDSSHVSEWSSNFIRILIYCVHTCWFSVFIKSPCLNRQTCTNVDTATSRVTFGLSHTCSDHVLRHDNDRTKTP